MFVFMLRRLLCEARRFYPTLVGCRSTLLWAVSYPTLVEGRKRLVRSRGDDGRRLGWRLGNGSAHSMRARRTACDALNRRGEMTRGPEPHCARDRADGSGGLVQQSGGGVDPAAHHEAMRRYTRGPIEEPREVIRAHVRDCRELLEPELPVQIVLDERNHPTNLARGKAADGHRRQPSVRRQQKPRPPLAATVE